MLTIHSILHPTDFSEGSLPAFYLACSLARDYGARLVLLHVIERPLLMHGDFLPTPDDLRGEMHEQLDRLRVPDPDAQVQRRLEHGDPVTEILRVAGDVHADLIVLGTHGRTGLSRLLMGSVAEQIVRRAACPVVTVKAPFPQTVPAPEPVAAKALAGSGI
jgi:nucleotide-binding universal stress UspA family protein